MIIYDNEMFYIKIKHLAAQSMNQERLAAAVDTLFFWPSLI